MHFGVNQSDERTHHLIEQICKWLRLKIHLRMLLFITEDIKSCAVMIGFSDRSSFSHLQSQIVSISLGQSGFESQLHWQFFAYFFSPCGTMYILRQGFSTSGPPPPNHAAIGERELLPPPDTLSDRKELLCSSRVAGFQHGCRLSCYCCHNFLLRLKLVAFFLSKYSFLAS